MISLFTGLNPSLHGVQARGQSLLPGATTLFKVFKAHGYRAPNISYLTEIANFANLGLEPMDAKYFETASRPGDELLEWLNNHHRSRFIVWYHYRFLHLPYKPQDKFNIYLTEKMKNSLQSEGVKKILEETVIPVGTASFTRADKEAVVALYDGQLRELDDFVKRLYGRMTRWKLHRNTLLVITADHGEELFEHGFVGHASTAINATMYDEVLKIPLIFYAPSRFKGGRILEEPVRQVDVMPTILDIVGLPTPEALDGVSLRRPMEGKGSASVLPAISESVSGGYQSSPEQEKIMLHAIRTDNWKLVRSEGPNLEDHQLFNLQKDPGETKNLFDTERETAQRLKEKLHVVLSKMQADRLAMLTREKVTFHKKDIPKDAVLAKPVVLYPKDQAEIRPKEVGSRLTVSWTGPKDLDYVIQYDVGKGLRNLKGSIPVNGTSKVFGPLPREAWEPLPYWNPYRIRISPYGLEKYWSEWVEFNIINE